MPTKQFIRHPKIYTKGAFYFFTNCLYIFVSAFLFAFSFPNFLVLNGIPACALFFLVPSIFVLKKTSPLMALLYGFIFGGLRYLLFAYWLFNFHKLALFLVVMGEGLYGAILFFAISICLFFVDKIEAKYQFKFPFKWLTALFVLVGIPIIYLFYELVKNSGFFAYPYGTLVYSFYQLKFVRDLSATVSLFLVGSFIASINCILYLLASSLIFKKSKWTFGVPLTVAVVAILFLFIHVAKSEDKKFVPTFNSENSFKILAVQSNQGIIDKKNWKGTIPKIDRAYKKSTAYEEDLTVLTRLTKSGLEQYQNEGKNIDLIVWSETAFIPSIDWYNKQGGAHKKLVDELFAFQRLVGIPILLGNSHSQLEASSKGKKKNVKAYYNAGLLISEGEVKHIYKKNRLVPFSEAYPFGDKFEGLKNFLEDKLDCSFWSRGEKNQAPFCVLKNGRRIFFSLNICYEDCFSSYVKQSSRACDFIINITNDSWAGSYAAQRQHLAFSQFVASQNKMSVVRVSQSGISCLIDSSGHVVKSLPEFEATYSLLELPLSSP